MQSSSDSTIEAREARRGFLAALAAFSLWGAFPLFLRLLRAATPLEIMAHRVAWCCAIVLLWLWAHGDLRAVAHALGTQRVRRRLLGSAALVSVNWLAFVWAVGEGRVLEASLGYFINPLVNVVLGVVLLSEKLSRRQWTAVAIAASGVVWLTLAAGAFPWIALVLALSFASYGLIRKLVVVDAVVGLAVETLMLTPLAVGYLAYLALEGRSAFGTSTGLSALLALSGPVTAIPLALFAFAARRIPFSTLGLIQYVGPTLQFATGVFVFREPFHASRMLGFGLIWTALALYVSDNVRRVATPVPVHHPD
jgi:chloramphenicol-sensitive protein RarD